MISDLKKTLIKNFFKNIFYVFLFLAFIFLLNTLLNKPNINSSFIDNEKLYYALYGSLINDVSNKKYTNFYNPYDLNKSSPLQNISFYHYNYQDNIPKMIHKGGKQLKHDDILYITHYVLRNISNLKELNHDNMGDLIIETLIVETLVGKSKYEYASRNYKNYGIAQIREDTAKWLLKVLKQKEHNSYKDLMIFYDNTLDFKENLLYNVPFSVAVCAEYYLIRNKNLALNIGNLDSRAKQWKIIYNTYKGLGSAEIYQQRVKKYYEDYIIL